MEVWLRDLSRDVITLFVVPSGYLIHEDLRSQPERLRKRVPRARRKLPSPILPSR